MQSCDKFKEHHSDAYLRIFKIFIKCLHRWFDIKIKIEPVKSKLQKQKEFEEFKISGIKDDMDYSDEIMGKSAEEMYREDLLNKTKTELECEETDVGKQRNCGGLTDQHY